MSANESELPARYGQPELPPERGSFEPYDNWGGTSMGGEIRGAYPMRDEWISASKDGLLDLREWA